MADLALCTLNAALLTLVVLANPPHDAEDLQELLVWTATRQHWLLRLLIRATLFATQ